MSVLWN